MSFADTLEEFGSFIRKERIAYERDETIDDLEKLGLATVGYIGEAYVKGVAKLLKNVKVEW